MLLSYYFYTGLMIAFINDLIFSFGNYWISMTGKGAAARYALTRWVAIHFPILRAMRVVMTAAYAFFSVSHLLTAAFKGVHTTFLFNDHVSKREAAGQ